MAHAGIVELVAPPRDGGCGCSHCPGCCSAGGEWAAHRFYTTSDLLEISGFRQHGNHTRMLEIEDPFALRPSEDLDSVGQERHFSVKMFSRQKGLDSEKMKFSEFISIPQIVELGKKGGKGNVLLRHFQSRMFLRFLFLAPSLVSGPPSVSVKKIKFFKKYLKHLSKH